MKLKTCDIGISKEWRKRKRPPTTINKQWPLKSIFGCEANENKKYWNSFGFFPTKTKQTQKTWLFVIITAIKIFLRWKILVVVSSKHTFRVYDFIHLFVCFHYYFRRNDFEAKNIDFCIAFYSIQAVKMHLRNRAITS